MTSGFDAFSLGLFTSLAPAGVVAFRHSRSCGSGRATARPQCASTA